MFHFSCQSLLLNLYYSDNICGINRPISLEFKDQNFAFILMSKKIIGTQVEWTKIKVQYWIMHNIKQTKFCLLFYLNNSIKTTKLHYLRWFYEKNSDYNLIDDALN